MKSDRSSYGSPTCFRLLHNEYGGVSALPFLYPRLGFAALAELTAIIYYRFMRFSFTLIATVSGFGLVCYMLFHGGHDRMSFLIYELFCFPFVCFLVSFLLQCLSFSQQNFHFAIQFMIVLLTGLYNSRACILCFFFFFGEGN